MMLVHFLDRAHLLNRSLFPAPEMLWATWKDSWSELLQPALRDTFFNSLLGLSISFVLGFLLAILLNWNRIVRETLFPFAIFLQTVPIVAIAPLLVIYLGFGSATIIAAATFVAMFPILAGTMIGLNSLTENQKNLFQLMRASRWKTLVHLQIPAAYPSLMIGVKNAAGLSVIGVVSGEFVAGSGLGSVIDAARTQQKIELVYIALVLLACIGLGFSAVLRFIHWSIHRIRPFAPELDLS